MANPRGLRAESGNSLPRVTVEKRRKMGVLSPAFCKKFALLYHVPSVSIYCLPSSSDQPPYVKSLMSLVHSKNPKAPDPHGCTMPAGGDALVPAHMFLTSTAKTQRRQNSKLTLEILGPIESLLFLEQKRIADKRESADRLAVCPVPISDTCTDKCRRERRGCSRIRPRNAFIVREVGRIILSFPTQIDARDLGRDVCWAFVGAHEVRGAVGA